MVAQSARILAKSARRGGWSPWAVDFYGDRDTREYSEACRQVNDGKGSWLDNAVIKAIASMTDRKGVALVVGSGFDGRTHVIDRLAQDFDLYGNPVETVTKVKQPKLFFSLLDRLQIRYPAIRFSKPSQTQGWLLKYGDSEGGRGVWSAGQVEPRLARKYYYQRQLQGQAASVLFLADGENHGIIGFNSQWTSAVDSRYPFQFGGVANWLDLTDEQRKRLEGYIGDLVRTLSLRGLNSLDFILDGDHCLVLEINPRPSASMDLYDEQFPNGLVDAHVRACQGDLKSQRYCFNQLKATRIVYARERLTIPFGQEWPEWSADRPKSGVTIGAFQPLCSVSACGVEPHAVMQQLKLREKSIVDRLTRRLRLIACFGEQQI